MKTKHATLGLCARVLLVLALTGLVALDTGTADTGSKQEPPPPRKIPGITSPDGFPRACVDCHVEYPELKLDARLGTLMSRLSTGVEAKLMARVQGLTPAGTQLKGVHPEVRLEGRDIPGTCVACHATGAGKVLPFARMMHVLHLHADGDNHFLSIFQGECTHCHKLDGRTGRWTVPSAPEKRAP